MLAKFENGYFLEVVHNEEDNEYNYSVYNEDMEQEDIYGGCTEYRSIEMYYPMNEIDYILEFCEPDYVKGKYELLKFETMEDYEDYLDDLEYGDIDGEWCLERQGTYEEDIRYYETEEDAKFVLQREYKEMLEDHDCPMAEHFDEYSAYIGEDEFYQSWTIYEKKSYASKVDEIIDKIKMELDRTYTGVDQYAFELSDTSVATDHVYRAKKLLKELEELIK